MTGWSVVVGEFGDATLDWLAARLGDLVDLPRVRATAERLATLAHLKDRKDDQ
jgi:hypothetical protein